MIFDYNFDTDASTIFASVRGYPESPMEFMTGVSLNLAPFAFRGGKMIIYDSVNDGIFSSVDLVNWYNAMDRAQFGQASNFARLFLALPIHDDLRFGAYAAFGTSGRTGSFGFFTA